MRISKDGYKSLEADGDRVDMESSDSVCRRSSIGSAYSAAHDGGTEVLEPIDEMKTGEEGKISVTSLVLEDIFMVPIVEDDFRSAYETTHVVMLDPPEKEHHFDPSDLPWRRALIISGLWFPKTWVNGSCRRITAYSVQGSFVILLLLYYLTESGVLLPMKKWESSVDMASHLPFTMAHYAIWESRWLITYVLGIFYGHSRHLEKFVAKMTLPYSMLKKSICCQYTYAILLLVAAVIMPTVLHWAELQRWGHEGKLIPIIDALIFFIYRLVSIPSFCLVAFSLYYVGCNILTLGYRLYRIPGNRGLNSAKREVLVTKRMTTDTELSLQWYLLVHLTLVILALVTGIFSCIERFHVVEKSNNVTIVESVGFGGRFEQKSLLHALTRLNAKLERLPSQHATNLINKHDQFLDEMQSRDEAYSRGEWSRLVTLLMPFMRELNSSQPMSITVPAKPTEEYIYAGKPMIVLISFCSIVETLVLYLIPLLLILWQKRCIYQIRSNIAALDTKIQEEEEYLFTTEEAKEEILKSLSLLSPVRAWGYEINALKTVMAACAAQVIAIGLRTVTQSS